MPPEQKHAMGPEKSVLSSLLKHPELLDEHPHLSAEHFVTGGNNLIFEQIRDTIAEQGDLDLVLFVQRLHDKGLLEDAGGPAAITDIFTYAPNGASFKRHLGELTRKLTLRRAQQLGPEIEAAIAEGKEPDEIAELVAMRSTVITETLEESRPPSDTPALLYASAKRWEALASGAKDPMGIETSLIEINQRFLGLKPCRVTVLSALPSHGKTLLAGQLFMDAVSQGARGLFLTWEMTEDELIDRFAAYEARMPLDAISAPVKYAKEVLRKEKVTREMALAIKQAFRKLQGYSFRVRAMHGQNIAQAAAAIRREHRKAPLGIVVMDFIQRVGAARHMEKQPYERQLTDIADRFQNLAQELGFHGIMLSQLNKDGAAKHAEAINESCALHLKVVNVPETGKDGTPLTDDDGQVKIKRRGLGVVKDRFHGQTGNLLAIGLNRENQRFERIENARFA